MSRTKYLHLSVLAYLPLEGDSGGECRLGQIQSEDDAEVVERSKVGRVVSRWKVSQRSSRIE